ncbi:MAG: Coenzyme F420 hydrogenase/dehydrogenase, beta subunit C-terminal domain [Bacteroides sp.]|nr:Coenzyme F420 hydrogenase/dehydrogenase, beta subunit C-terminal domain [Bacteroides sp.]
MQPKFRIKDHQSTASDYSFGCNDSKGEQHTIKMRKVGDMWGSGMFKNNACDFCDDVTTELADISLGDAWINPYRNDGKGTNIIITRSKTAEKLIQNGKQGNEIYIDLIPMDLLIQSQNGNYNHRYNGIGYRINKAENKGFIIPPKRRNNTKISIEFKWVQKKRMIVRKKSLVIWGVVKDSTEFDQMMLNSLKKLQNRTRIYHYIRAIKKRLGL